MSYCEEDLHPEAKEFLQMLRSNFRDLNRGFGLRFHHGVCKQAIEKERNQLNEDKLKAVKIVIQELKAIRLLKGG